MYGVHNCAVGSSTSKRSKVSCCGKLNPPLSIVVGDIDKGSKSSDDLEYLNINTMEYKTWKLRVRIMLETMMTQ